MLLLFLTLLSFFSAYMALLTTFIFTFLVPGLIFSRFFKLKSYELLAFVPIISVLTSTQLTYYLSLLFGYSRDIILVSFLVLTAIYVIVLSRKREVSPFGGFSRIKRFSKANAAVFFLIFVLCLVVLFRSVWFENNYGIVITGSNWQDTPLHYEIIESINNGNFPPQMPYYSGEKMSYHYFVDFHTAILEKAYGFLPKLVPFLDAVFILIFAVSVYGLARGNGRRTAIIAAVIATFGWGFSYFGLFSALVNGQFNPYTNYMYQYQGFYGLPQIFDNLLQQRPMLVGLPVFALVLALLRGMDDKKRIVLAGIVTGLVFPFHVFSFICAYVAFFFSVLLNLKNFKWSHLYFLVSAVIALPFIVTGSSTVMFSLAPLWALNFVQGNPVVYYVANLGIPFLISLGSLIFFRRSKEKLLVVVFIILFLVPNFVSLTPNAWDMYKFFIFAWVPIAVLTGIALARIRKVLAFGLILLCVLASASVIIYNVGTNYSGASWDEYNLGMWVRDNTEQGSVFLAYCSIHCPPTMIGGRLRVLSYVNWPYGHGIPFNDISKRAHDIDRAYNGTEADLREVVGTYNVDYVYVGGEEQRNYPGCITRLNNVSWLEPVYSQNDLRIYDVNLPQNSSLPSS
jgi:hypothetical protein